MTSLILLLLAFFLFAAGYRFFGKLLGVFVFRPLATTPVAKATSTSTLFVQGAAASIGAVMFPALVIVLIWGWAPGYLWVLAGSLLMGAVMGLGYTWLRDLHPQRDAAQASRMAVGPVAARAMSWQTTLLLVILAPLAVLTAGAVVVRYPQIIWLLPVQLLCGWLVFPGKTGEALGGTGRVWGYPVSLLVMGCMAGISVIFLPSPAPAFDWLGGVLGGVAPMNLAMASLLLALSWVAAMSPALRHRRRRIDGFLVLGGFLLLMVPGVLALAVVRPDPALPEFHRTPDLPPGLLAAVLLVGGGVVTALTSLTRGGGGESLNLVQRIRVGFGAALIPAMLAVFCVVLLSADLSEFGLWLSLPDWHGIVNPGDLVSAFVDRLAALSGILYLPGDAVAVFAAWAVVAACLVCLDLCLVRLDETAREAVDHKEFPFSKWPRLIPLAPWMPLVGLALILMYFGLTGPAVKSWMIIGLVSVPAAVAVLVSIAVALMRMRRSTFFVVAPSVVLISAYLWGGAILVRQWLDINRWPEIVITLVAGTVMVWMLIAVMAVVGAHRRSRRQEIAGETGPMDHSS